MAVRITDGISPELARKAKQLRDRRPVLEAMGLELVSLTKRAFTDPSLRPSPWAPRKGGKGEDEKQGRDAVGRFTEKGHPLLRKSGALWQSIRISAVTQDHVDVSTDRPYAAVQQLGSRKKTGRGGGIPPRPFFPFLHGKITPFALARITAVAKRKIDSILGAKQG